MQAETVWTLKYIFVNAILIKHRPLLTFTPTHAIFHSKIWQHCWIVLWGDVKELAKRVQHPATSKNAATKILPFPKFIKNHATR